MGQERVLLSIICAAERLSLGRSKVYELMQAGELRAVRIGRAVRIPTSEVDGYAARLLQEVDAEAPAAR